jgi:N6-adenosine-specific RNA methylase IME4
MRLAKDGGLVFVCMLIASLSVPQGFHNYSNNFGTVLFLWITHTTAITDSVVLASRGLGVKNELFWTDMRNWGNGFLGSPIIRISS